MRNPNKITIKDKSHCCGCEACVQRCPRHCITLQVDREGFHYPRIDASQCIECGICQRVCPHHNPAPARQPLATYAAYNADDATRLSSSSGGIFTLLAEQVLRQGGVVFGVRWDDDWHAVFDYVEHPSHLHRFRGSKYLQARVGAAYAQAEQFLQSGRQVLFSGTPCQVRALRLYLRRTYPNLLCVDVICHGVPSPAVFQSYLTDTIALTAQQHALQPAELRIADVQFRDKRTGWKAFNTTLRLVGASGEQYTITSHFGDNPYMQGFIRNIYLRPSCHACPAKAGSSGADITLGDYWGIEHLRPAIDDDRGTSAVLLHTPLGESAFMSLPAERHLMDYQSVKQHNSPIHQSMPKPSRRARFFRSRQPFHATMARLFNITPYEKYRFIIKNILRKICG